MSCCLRPPAASLLVLHIVQPIIQASFKAPYYWPFGFHRSLPNTPHKGPAIVPFPGPKRLFGIQSRTWRFSVHNSHDNWTVYRLWVLVGKFVFFDIASFTALLWVTRVGHIYWKDNWPHFVITWSHLVGNQWKTLYTTIENPSYFFMTLSCTEAIQSFISHFNQYNLVEPSWDNITSWVWQGVKHWFRKLWRRVWHHRHFGNSISWKWQYFNFPPRQAQT